MAESLTDFLTKLLQRFLPFSDEEVKEPQNSTVEEKEEKPTDAIVKIDHENRCSICLDDFVEPKTLDLCSHKFCTTCIDEYFRVKPQCPCCFVIYGEIRGDQPDDGNMYIRKTRHRLPGFKETSTGTIEVYYQFPDGIQTERHPHPGVPYKGTTRQAFLPDNQEGRHVLKLLCKSFEARQTFTIGESRTTGQKNVVTWNDIHHKTSYCGGPENFGYPDETYLNRVQQELAAKGIR